jgi:hypothetical protein
MRDARAATSIQIEGSITMQSPGQPPLPNTISKTMVHPCPMPSPSINELALGEVDPMDHTIASCHEALRVARICAENVHKAALSIHANPLLSEGKKHVEADQVSFKATQRALPVMDRANQNVLMEISRIRTKIAGPAIDNSISQVQLRTEIRLFLRDQTSADRRKEVTRSIASGDDQTMSAIASGPPMLSGLSSQEIEGFLTMWRAKKFPDELKRLERLEKVEAAMSLAGELLISWQRRMSNPAIVSEAAKFAKASADAVRAATGAH